MRKTGFCSYDSRKSKSDWNTLCQKKTTFSGGFFARFTKIPTYVA